MKNKLKEMLLQHKPITEQTSPVEETNHTVADAIEEAFLIPKSIRMNHNLRKLNKQLNKHNKKYNAQIDKMDQFQKDTLEVAKTIDPELKANFDKTNQSHIETEKGILARSVKNVHQAASKYEDLFTKKNSKKIDKFLDNPVYRNKMVLKNKLAKTGNPELFKEKANERLKQRAEAEAEAAAAKESPKWGPKWYEGPEWDEFKSALMKADQTPHEKVWRDGEAAKERARKFRSSQSDHNEKNPYDRELAVNALARDKKSLRERLELVKSGIFLNEESDDITALRNKISQGLIILPGLKGSAADKMEDAIRGWEDQINKLKNKIGEKYE